MKVLIVGAGISGIGAAKFLRQNNHEVYISEQKRITGEDAQALKDAGVKVFDEGHQSSHLNGVSLVVASPGLPENHLLLKLAREKEIPVTSEIDLALAEIKSTIFAVTGTNGKSTTVALIDHGLKKLGFSSAPGGNFGDPPTLMLAENRVPEHLALELSSYQLEQSSNISAACAIITSFSNDHMARHGSEEAYFKSKWKLVTATEKDFPVIISTDVAKAALLFGCALRDDTYIVGETFSSDLSRFNLVVITGTKVRGPHGLEADVAPQHLKGPHNVRNLVCAALAIHLVKNVPFAHAAALMADYPGLPHRCEFLGTFAGIEVYNDSKATNVESTLVALQAMPSKVILLMGGIGKGESYLPILSEKNKIALLLTFGTTGPDIAAALSPKIAVREFPTLASLLSEISGIMRDNNHPVLFSPGCASFDEFRNFAHRGEYFSKQLSQVLLSKK